MPYDPERHHSRSIRLAEHDYTGPGVYFITMCTQARGTPLGTIRAGRVILHGGGAMVGDYWLALPGRFAVVTLDAWVVMPDHLHGLIILGNAPVADDGGGVGGDDGGGVGGDDGGGVGGDHVGGVGGDDGGGVGGDDGGGVGGDDGGGVGGDHVGSPLRQRVDDRRVAIGDVIGWFKTMTTNAYIRGVRNHGWPPFRDRFWQRNYYERIVRTHADLERVRTYIANNPVAYRRPR